MSWLIHIFTSEWAENVLTGSWFTVIEKYRHMQKLETHLVSEPLFF